MLDLQNAGFNNNTNKKTNKSGKGYHEKYGMLFPMGVSVIFEQQF
jgi:hypothetical protein